MTYWQRLWRIQLIGLAALVVFGFILASFFVIEGLIVSPQEIEVPETIMFVLLFTMLFGTLPVLLLGAPLYAAIHLPAALR